MLWKRSGPPGPVINCRLTICGLTCSATLWSRMGTGRADDPAIVGGIGLFAGQPVTVITTSRGHKLEERLAKHFGQPEPAGYRKAARLIKMRPALSGRFSFLLIRPGAFPGKEAEYAGQGL